MSTHAAVLNFAYGSNMLSRRLQERVRSARAVGIGVLRGHRLCWHKTGKDGSGKCDIVRSSETQDLVCGVIFELQAGEKPLLDEAEGLGQGYAEKQVEIETEAGLVTAMTYYATKVDAVLVPYTWYKALVVAGAREHGLPPAYIAMLEAAPSKADANITRAARYFSFANDG